ASETDRITSAYSRQSSKGSLGYSRQIASRGAIAIARRVGGQVAASTIIVIVTETPNAVAADSANEIGRNNEEAQPIASSNGNAMSAPTPSWRAPWLNSIARIRLSDAPSARRTPISRVRRPIERAMRP